MNDIAANLALPARWLVVVGIAYTLATSVLYFLAPPPGTSQGGPVGMGSAAERPATDINAILASNLFGTADADDAEDSAPVETAVETTLPLELLGVFVADVAEDSAAIISQRGRAGLLYAVGDSVPGNATLVEVQADHVILRRAGTRETLYFPSPAESLATRTRNPLRDPAPDPAEYMDDHDAVEALYQDEAAYYGDDEPGSAEPTMGELISDYQERLEQDPSGALADLGVSPVAEGAAEGYRVGELADTPYLSQTGLQPGDVILSVNGRPVGDLNQDRLELDNVLAQGSARLEVQRGSRRFFVTAALDR